MRKRISQVCSYCCATPETEEDHVIARQFFPNDPRYRSALPKVPCCAACNRAKQRVEDGPAVFFQFGHSSMASRTVLDRRVRRTLGHNRRLMRSLRGGLHEAWVRAHTGILVPGLVIELRPR